MIFSKTPIFYFRFAPGVVLLVLVVTRLLIGTDLTGVREGVADALLTTEADYFFSSISSESSPSVKSERFALLVPTIA